MSQKSLRIKIPKVRKDILNFFQGASFVLSGSTAFCLLWQERLHVQDKTIVPVGDIFANEGQTKEGPRMAAPSLSARQLSLSITVPILQGRAGGPQEAHSRHCAHR